jgi:hypothetical protein
MREEWGEEKVYAKNKYPHGKAGNALLYSQFVIKGKSIDGGRRGPKGGQQNKLFIFGGDLDGGKSIQKFKNTEYKQTGIIDIGPSKK